MGKSFMIEMDKARNVKYPFNELITLEELLGKPIAEIEKSISFKDIRILAFCGLKWEDKELTLEQTGELITEFTDNGGEMKALMDACGKALKQGMGANKTPSKK